MGSLETVKFGVDGNDGGPYGFVKRRLLGTLESVVTGVDCLDVFLIRRHRSDLGFDDVTNVGRESSGEYPLLETGDFSHTFQTFFTDEIVYAL